MTTLGVCVAMLLLSCRAGRCMHQQPADSQQHLLMHLMCCRDTHARALSGGRWDRVCPWCLAGLRAKATAHPSNVC